MFAEEKLSVIFLALYFITYFFANKHTIPVLKLVAHWCRWFSFAFFLSYLLVIFELSSRPDWVHFIIGMGLWFILETLFFRVSVQLLNSSEVPLFPKYQRDSIDNLWPINNRALKIKDYLLNESFENIGVIKAELMKGFSIRQSMFLDKTKNVRVNVVFIPNAKNEIKCYFSLFSINNNGDYLITDNLNIPFGGFYPDHWSVNRYPLCQSLDKLRKKHILKMEVIGLNWEVLDTDLLNKVNKCQLELETINQKMGFFSYSEEEANAQITSEGSNRICLEMWLLSYLGKTFH